MSTDTPSPTRCRILLISGSLRAGSTHTAVLKTARALAPAGVAATLYRVLADLPAFNPDDEQGPLPSAPATLRAMLAAADAGLFSTPEYAGSLPGSFKSGVHGASLTTIASPTLPMSLVADA